jgi:exonuclease SbcD
MLTFFHTADWHLGQSFYGFDRDYEHTQFLNWLLAELQSRCPDALIVSGDIFDSVNPSATAQHRYYSFLAAAHRAVPDLQIVITAGNHDAGARLEAPAELLNSLNIKVVGTVTRDKLGNPQLDRFLVPLRDKHGQVRAIVLAIPFLRPSDVPVLENSADPYLDGIRELYRRAVEAAVELRTQLCPDGALIAMGHCHLLGGMESRDSERRLFIGGAEAISPDMFPAELSYVALGHLHRPQQFCGGRIRYSGSTIPLSFSEASYTHQVLQGTLEGNDLTGVEGLLVPRTTALLSIPDSGCAPIEQVLQELQTLASDATLPHELQPFLEVRIREEGPDPARRKRIEEVLTDKAVRLATIRVENAVRNKLQLTEDSMLDETDLKSISPEEIFLNAYQERYGQSADESLLLAFREILLQEAPAS